jgi:cytidylate kinase
MPLITISQSTGSQGLAVAQRVAEVLAYELFDDDTLQQMARELGVFTGDVRSVDEKAPGLFDRILGHRPRLYLDVMESVIYEVARKGEGVIIGHGSQMLLSDFGCAFHVRIHASEAIRIRNIAAQQGLSHKAAEKLIRTSDNEQKGFFRYAFRLDWNDPSLYDLIINTGKLSAVTAAQLIIDSLRSEDVLSCGLNALETMERISQEKQIHAALLKNDIDVFTLNVDVPQKGVAHITGLARSLEEKARIPEVVKGVPGIEQVVSEVSTRSK